MNPGIRERVGMGNPGSRGLRGRNGQGHKHVVYKQQAPHPPGIPGPKTLATHESVFGYNISPLIKQVSWSSLALQTRIGAFSMRTDNMEAMETLRGAIRSLVFGSNCFETRWSRSLASPSSSREPVPMWTRTY